MSIFQRAKVNAQAKMWVAGRARRDFAGSAKAAYRYNKFRSVTASFYSNEALDEEIIIQSLKDITRVANVLKGFNEKMFNTIYNAYSGSDKLHKHLMELLEAYVTYIKQFTDAFKLALEAISKASKQVQSVGQMLFEDVEAYVLEAESRIQKGEFFVTANIMDEMSKKFRKISLKQEKKMKRLIQRESIDIEKVRNHKMIKTGIGSKSRLLFEGFKHKHILNKLGHRGFGKVMEDRAKLDELISTQLNSEYFAILQRYFQDIDKCEGLAYKLNRDLVLFIETIEQDVQIVKNSFHTFGVLFKNEETVKEIAVPLMKQLEILSINSFQEITQEVKNEEELEKTIEHFNAVVPKLLHEIGMESEKLLKELQTAKT